jgi:hypothetical protein
MTQSPVYANTWAHSGSQLAAIYWGGRAPGTDFGDVFVPLGYRYLIVGKTEWWNGTRWFVQSRRTLGACTF